MLQQLIDALRILPGVGPKSAQRIALQLLERNRSGAVQLSKALAVAMEKVGHCQQCRTFSESDSCDLCRHPVRGQSPLLCVVASAADLYAIEQTGLFAGRDFLQRGQL